MGWVKRTRGWAQGLWCWRAFGAGRISSCPEVILSEAKDLRRIPARRVPKVILSEAKDLRRIPTRRVPKVILSEATSGAFPRGDSGGPSLRFARSG
jgi:hypothetical protein